MRNLHEIHRPTTLADALELLQEPDTAALAGGTQLIAGARRDVRAVVDLSALGLSFIRESDGAIAVGATTTLADLAESPILRATANGVIAQAAHRSAASVLRNQGTIAGTLITDPEGLLAAALLALDAEVKIVRKEPRLSPLGEFLQMREHLLTMALLTEVRIPLANPRAALETVARSPSDKPIVGVCVAARIEQGNARNVRIALGGVAEHAVRALEAEQALEGKTLGESAIEAAARLAANGLAPRGDFRGSVEYRKEMAIVLTRRALNGLG